MTKTMSFENGKYVVYLYDNGVVKVQRYREDWRDFTGDKFISLLVSKIFELAERTPLTKDTNAMNSVCRLFVE